MFFIGSMACNDLFDKLGVPATTPWRPATALGMMAETNHDAMELAALMHYFRYGGKLVVTDEEGFQITCSCSGNLSPEQRAAMEPLPRHLPDGAAVADAGTVQALDKALVLAGAQGVAQALVQGAQDAVDRQESGDDAPAIEEDQCHKTELPEPAKWWQYVRSLVAPIREWWSK